MCGQDGLMRRRSTEMYGSMYLRKFSCIFLNSNNDPDISLLANKTRYIRMSGCNSNILSPKSFTCVLSLKEKSGCETSQENLPTHSSVNSTSHTRPS